ncbi:MAG: M20 family metallopeptidase [Myxococcales bacterium FL481]|nr:MAG: M20 family metallopeptidase [Myxococcales bacterium FL481]
MSPQSVTRLRQDLCAAVDSSFEAEHVPWLTRLVDQPSYTGARDNVERAAQIIDEMAATLSMRRVLVPDPSGTFADHRVYSAPGVAEDTRAMALVGHVDTVFPESLGFLRLNRDPPDSESGGDVIRGPGTLDMKSGLSSIVFALRAIARCAPEVYDGLRVRFVCNSDEEVGSPSSHDLFKELATRTTSAMVFEAGRVEDRIITARKGGGSFRFTMQGKAAHAGNEHAKGVNAIHALALLVPRIEAITDYGRGITVNVGLVSGGTAKNTVPETAWCQVDTRFVTREGADYVVAELERIAAAPFEGMGDVPERAKAARCELSGRVTRLPMEPVEATQVLRRLYEPYAAAQDIGVGEAPLQGGGSDANLLAGYGVPCIDGLGPWGRAFHSVDEWSSLDSLRRRTRALACFLVSEAVAGGAAVSGALA